MDQTSFKRTQSENHQQQNHAQFPQKLKQNLDITKPRDLYSLFGTECSSDDLNSILLNLNHIQPKRRIRFTFNIFHKNNEDCSEDKKRAATLNNTKNKKDFLRNTSKSSLRKTKRNNSIKRQGKNVNVDGNQAEKKLLSNLSWSELDSESQDKKTIESSGIQKKGNKKVGFLEASGLVSVEVLDKDADFGEGVSRRADFSPSDLFVGENNFPRASSTLELTDYAKYPKVYWELRDQTIGQPEDLISDMIDRELYRRQQISSLKLSSMETTMYSNTDFYKNWKNKSGESISSPRLNRRLNLNKNTYDMLDNKQNGVKGSSSKLSPLLKPGNTTNENLEETFSKNLEINTLKNSINPLDHNGNLETFLPYINNENIFENTDTSDSKTSSANQIEGMKNSNIKHKNNSKSREKVVIKGNTSVICLEALGNIPIHEQQNTKNETVTKIFTSLPSIDQYSLSSTSGSQKEFTCEHKNEPEVTTFPKVIDCENETKKDSISNHETISSGSKKQAAQLPTLVFSPPENASFMRNATALGCLNYVDKAYVTDPDFNFSNKTTQIENKENTTSRRSRNSAPLKLVKLEVFSERRQNRSKSSSSEIGKSENVSLPAIGLNYNTSLPNTELTCQATNRSIATSLTEQVTQETLSSRNDRSDVNIRFVGNGKIVVTSSSEESH